MLLGETVQEECLNEGNLKNISEKLEVIKITKKYNRKLKDEPSRLNGGFMHKMYKIDTQKGTYALKLLNPYVMQRKTADEKNWNGRG